MWEWFVFYQGSFSFAMEFSSSDLRGKMKKKISSRSLQRLTIWHECYQLRGGGEGEVGTQLALEFQTKPA